MNKRIAFVCPDAFSIWIFRLGLAKALMARGYEIYAVTKTDQYASELEAYGIRHIAVNFERFLSIKEDFSLLLQLLKIFKRYQFNIVHNFTIKANIYGTIMARLAGVPQIYNSVTGLGFLYTYEWEKGLHTTLMKKGVAALYAIASRLATRTWFQNQDDVTYFLNRKLISPKRAVMIKSSGIDTDFWNIERFPLRMRQKLRSELNLTPDQTAVIMVSRALRAKGIFEFLGAADILREKCPSIKFILVGGTEEEGHDGISARSLEKEMHKTDNNFLWLGHRHDIPLLLASSDVCVLPSYYREGVPRNLLEGMSMSKPIVTTNAVGCKETVHDGWNGYLITPKNKEELANTLKKLCHDKELMRKMGKNSRLKVENEFDERIVVGALLTEIYHIQ